MDAPSLARGLSLVVAVVLVEGGVLQRRTAGEDAAAVLEVVEVDLAPGAVEGVVEGAAEAAPLGEDRDDARPAGLVVGRQPGRVGDRRERALARARAS